MKIITPTPTEDAREFAWNCLADFIDELDESCVDNERVALAQDEAEMAAYQEQVENGCCGSLDRMVIDPVTGLKFYVGCNYGH